MPCQGFPNPAHCPVAIIRKTFVGELNKPLSVEKWRYTTTTQIFKDISHTEKQDKSNSTSHVCAIGHHVLVLDKDPLFLSRILPFKDAPKQMTVSVSVPFPLHGALVTIYHSTFTLVGISLGYIEHY